MSTTSINYKIAEALHFKIESLAQELKGFKWNITEADLGQHIVENRIHLATAFALSQLCAEIDGDDQTLIRLTDKITNANKIIEGLSISSLEDPRLKELPIKIEQLYQNCLHKAKKMEKYGKYLNMIALCDQIPYSKILPLQIRLKRASLELENPYEAPPVFDPADEISPIISLQSAIHSLSLYPPKEGFGRALDRILWLEDLTFITCTEDKEQIANRIFFHLQSIYKKESPQKAGLNDVHYGSKAFLSEETPTAEKLRAIQRTQVEISLFALEKCLKGDEAIQSPIANVPTMKGILTILEDLKMDPKDIPQDQKNLAHALFGKLYTIYLAAWEKNKSMIHPHDRIFKNDFGRNAFVGDSKDRIPNTYKIQAINEINRSLQGAWGL